MNKIKVLIADAHRLMREALRVAVEIEADMDVVGEARNGDETVARARALSPDVILIDIYIPDEKDGLKAINSLRSLNDQNRIVVLSSSTEDGLAEAAFQSGASAYILKDALKDAPRAELLRAIRQAA